MDHNSHTTGKLDFSRHKFTTNGIGELLNAKTYKPTGQISEKCKNIISEKDFEFDLDGKIINKCDSSECKCVNAMNGSLFSYNMLAEDAVYII